MDSHIVISSNIEEQLLELQDRFQANRTITLLRDEFKVEDAKAAIAEAYIAEMDKKYIILASARFNVYAQNMLLKALEEPPRNIVFIIITSSKNSLLPTIRSRLPLTQNSKKVAPKEIELDLKRVSYGDIFEFVKQNTTLKKDEAIELIEAIFAKALKQNIKPTSTMLSNYELAIKSLNLNGNTQAVLLNLLLGFVNAS